MVLHAQICERRSLRGVISSGPLRSRAAGSCVYAEPARAGPSDESQTGFWRIAHPRITTQELLPPDYPASSPVTFEPRLARRVGRVDSPSHCPSAVTLSVGRNADEKCRRNHDMPVERYPIDSENMRQPKWSRICLKLHAREIPISDCRAQSGPGIGAVRPAIWVCETVRVGRVS